MTREEAIDIIKCLAWYTRPNEEDIEQAIKVLEQEPFINKPCISDEVCEHDKQMVLDKIRAEIKTLTSNRGFLSCSIDYIHEDIDTVFDKYKEEYKQTNAESEES